MTTVRIGLLMMLSGSVIGCGNGTGGGGALTVEEFGAKATAALCAAQSRCGNFAPYLCQTSAFRFEVPDFAAASKAGRIKFDAAKAQACLDFFNNASCDGLDSAEPDACRDAVTGTVAAGGACYNSIDCAGGTCQTTNNACPGQCVAYLASGADCTKGGSCDSKAGDSCVNGKCGKPGSAGAACQFSGECANGLACVGGTCGARGVAGATCKSNSDCASAFYCMTAGMSRTCAAKVAAGGACGEDAAHAPFADEQCVTGTVCAGFVYNAQTQAITPGKCAAPQGEGGPCTNVTENMTVITGCQLGLVCSAGKCARPPTTGTCALDAFTPCMPGAAWCDSATKTCMPTKADGAACMSGNQCQSLDCVNGACAPSSTCKEI